MGKICLLLGLGSDFGAGCVVALRDLVWLTVQIV